MSEKAMAADFGPPWWCDEEDDPVEGGNGSLEYLLLTDRGTNPSIVVGSTRSKEIARIILDEELGCG